MTKKTRQCKTAVDAAIVGGQIYFEDVRQCALESDAAGDILSDKHLKAVRLISLSENWNLGVWLDNGIRITESLNLQMTIRKERRGNQDHWYAYRRVLGKLYKRYVGTTEKLTEWRLLEIAQKLPG